MYDAFEHAEYLNDYDLLQGRTNTVTLLVDEIYGLGDQDQDQDQDDPVYDTQIKIDYDVTLDLNGFGLSIDGFESFIVQETGDFTITDSRYDGEERVGIWSWTTEEDVPVIKNSGSTSITSAYVFSDNLIVDNEGGVLDVVDSDIQSFYDITINNSGEVKIFDSTITSGEVDHLENKYYAGDYVINNEGKCSLEISNSKVSFVDGLDDGSQKTAVIYFNNSNTAENNFAYFKMDGGKVLGGTVITGENVVYSRAEAIQLFGNVKATISGDALVNSYSFNAVTLAPIYADEEEEVVSVPAGELTITGGTITSTDGSAIVNYGDVTISGGTITSEEGNAIVNDGELTITDGTITSENNRAVTNYGDLTISGGNLSSSAGYVSSEDEGYVAEDSEDYEDQNCRGTIYNWSNLTITGGTIESEYCRALYNSGTTTITGGTIEALEDMAIMNFAELTVGKIPAESNDAIKIITDSNYTDIPAIYCDGGYFDMYYGTVTCPAGAVILENGNKGTITGGKFVSSNDDTIKILNGSDCTISGGVISSSCSAILLDGAIGKISGGVIRNNSNTMETIKILDGASCTISGGVIYSEGDIATIACRSTGNVSTEISKLWITWPEKRNNEGEIIGYNQGSVEGPYEPLIYSFGSSYQSSPISANYDNEYNTAEVYIQGGYLLTHNQNSHGFFYNDDRSPERQSEVFDNLKLSQCGQFYANTYRVNMQGNVYDPACDIDLNSYFSVSEYSGLSYIPGFFEDYFDKKDFKDGFPKETVLYYFE